jgi:hypothetical protein
LETLDDFGDEPEIDASATEDDVSSSGVEVTDGAAAGWTEIDDAMNQGPRIESGKGSVDEYAEALTDLRDVETEFGASDASETTPDAAIAEMDFDDDLVIDEALSSIESSAEGEVGSSASQDTTEQEPVVADAGNAESRAGESASSNEADDSDAYESIEAEIDAAFEAALEEDVSPSPESSHQLAGSSSSTDDDDATMRVASAIEDAQVAEMPSIEGERGESGSASHLEPPEPAATLVDDAGEGVASAIDVEEVPGLVDSAAEGDLADQDSESKSVGIVDDEMQVLADADSADSDIADTNLDFIETNQSSAELDSPLVASAATGSAANSREERVFAEMVSALSPEGERWIRGSGGYETPRGFPVKGNASSRLYHMPGGRNYTATIPEICFANAEDAQTAGFRARSGDPTEIDLSLVQETNVPERFGIRAEVTDEVAEHAEGALIGEGGEMPGEGSGWVRSDGSRDCPSDFPVKGNASSRIYHIPGGGSYDATIPEFCFASPEDAESAGFRGAKN